MADKRYRNFTFKIDFDYLINGMYPDPNVQPTFEQRQALRDQLYAEKSRNFGNLVAHFAGSKGTAERHNKDFRHNKDNSVIIENGLPKPDDDHMHFTFWDAQNALTEAQWRQILDNYGLHLTDGTRKGKYKDWQSLAKKNLPNAVAYQLHRTVKSIAQHKHAYDEDSMLLFNVSKNELDDLLAKAVKNDLKGKELDDQKMTDLADRLTNEIRQGLTINDAEQESIKEFGKQQPQFWRRYHKHLEEERQAYTDKLFHQLVFRSRNFSLFYLYGTGGSGKSILADQLGYYFADKSDRGVHLTAPNGKKKTPDFVSTYKGELVSVAHEMKPVQLGVDEFESIFEPYKYSIVNSRNSDKPYLAQAAIITNALKPQFWLYNMIYDDYLSGEAASMRYGWKNTIQVEGQDGKKKPQTVRFPRTYVDFITLRKDPKTEITRWKKQHIFPDDGQTPEEISLHDYHWSLKGAIRFLDDWWQIVRRLKYTFAVSSKNNEMNIMVYQLNASSKPACLDWDEEKIAAMPVEEFFDMFDFQNHYNFMGMFECKYMLNVPELHKTLNEILAKLEMHGLKIEDHLPKLLSKEEFDKFINGDDDQQNEQMHVVKSE